MTGQRRAVRADAGAQSAHTPVHGAAVSVLIVGADHDGDHRGHPVRRVQRDARAARRRFKQLFAVVRPPRRSSARSSSSSPGRSTTSAAVTSATNLAVLLPMVDEKSFLGRLLGDDRHVPRSGGSSVLAIGLAVLYRRRTQPIASTLLGVYAVIVARASPPS